MIFGASFENDQAYCIFSFEFQGKHYETKVSMMGDWLGGEFMELIEHALNEKWRRRQDLLL